LITVAGTTRRISDPDLAGEYSSPLISADGTKVVFENRSAPSWANHVHVFDLRTGQAELASVATSGAEGNDWSFAPSISADGTKVAFYSDATNLAAGDTNAKPDVFVRDLAAGPEARWALTDLSVTPTKVRPAQWVIATAWLKNVGEAAGTYTATLKLDGQVVAERAVALRSNRDTRVSFTFRSPAVGIHPLTLGPLSTQLTVRR
jgi:hypothetical protein